MATRHRNKLRHYLNRIEKNNDYLFRGAAESSSVKSIVHRNSTARRKHQQNIKLRRRSVNLQTKVWPDLKGK